MQLEKENASLGIFGMLADLVLQFEQRFVRLAGGKVFFGGHRFCQPIKLVRQDSETVAAPKTGKIGANGRFGRRCSG
jgi:hypothetical protein